MSLARHCRHRAALENHIPDTMAEAQSTLFELRLRAICRSRCEAIYSVSKYWLCAEYIEHLLRVFLPICGEMEIPAWPQP